MRMGNCKTREHEHAQASQFELQKRVRCAFYQWVDAEEVDWACVTLKGRILPRVLGAAEAQLIYDGSLSRNHLGQSFSQKKLEQGFNRLMKQLNFMYTPLKQRKRGMRLRCVPFEGGNPEDGVMPHIHALIEIPSGTSIDEFADYMSRLARKKMEGVYKQHNPARLKTDLWCEKYEHHGNQFLSYALRNEGDNDNHISLDKLITGSLYLPAAHHLQ